MNVSAEPPQPRALVLFGVPFHDVTFAEAVDWCIARIRARRPSIVATANVDFLLQAARDPELKRILLEADLVIADGMPIVWLSERFGPRLRERVTGSDITPMLAAACAREGFSLFLLGGAPGVPEKAAAELQRANPGLKIAGCYSPPMADLLNMNHAEILARIREANPDVLLVAFGAPKQEKFMNLHARNWSVPLALGIGGTLDFIAGVQIRAPKFVQKIGMEWFWRMMTNPRRLFRRYVGNIGYLYRTVRTFERIRQTPPGSAFEQAPADPWSALDTPAAYPIFNLGNRDWLNSEELGRLVQAARQARRRGDALIVCGGTPRVERLLAASDLTAYLEYHPTREAAEARRQQLVDEARKGIIRSEGDAFIVQLPAELSIARLPDWRMRFEAVWKEPGSSIILSADHLEFLDSAGIGWLVETAARCRREGRAFRASGFRGAALQSLKIAKMDAWIIAPQWQAGKS